ncbi:hypothetical protein FB451DRAFT_1409203 [Mycena latifolia]|nr:hypothetical protein FB451DRAFT_1409203 [Mycena latifolia]
MSAVLNTVPCAGIGNTSDGCTEIFPRAPPGLLCQKCQKIKGAATIALQEELRQTLKSCQGCGVCGSMIQDKLCGTCKRKGLLTSYGRPAGGEEDPDAIAAKQQRLDKIRRSVASGQPLQNVSNVHQAGATTSLQELEMLRTASQKGQWTLFVTPRRGKTLDGQLGNATFVMLGSTKLTDALVRIVEHFNLGWVRMDNHALDLKPEDCSLRFAGNITVDTETEDMTIQEVYLTYQKRPDRAFVVSDAKKLKLPKGASMSWELSINETRYNNRLQGLFEDDADSLLSTRKRKSSLSSPVPKRSRMSGQALTSSFSGEDNYSALYKLPESRVVTFETLQCEPEGTEGRHTLVQAPDPQDPECRLQQTGKLDAKPLILSLNDRGRSKDVYKLVIDGEQQVYVAKHFFDVGKGRGLIPRRQNRALLGRDLIRIGRMRWFYERFTTLATAKGFNELAYHVCEQEDLEDAYLVEPLRTSVVNKFTGTMGSSGSTDKLTSTIWPSAILFCKTPHAYWPSPISKASYPGSRHKGSLILFDPMTHTIVGKSGLGDHGPPGIKDAIESHTCNAFCKALDLCSTEVLLSSLDARMQEHETANAQALVTHGSDSDSG